MLLAALLVVAQAPAVLQVRLRLPVGTPDRGIPLRIASETRDGRVELTSLSNGDGNVSFHIEGAVVAAAVPWRLWIGGSADPEAGELRLAPGATREVVVDLREYAFPLIHEIESGWNSLVEILDSRSLRVLGSYAPPTHSPFPLESDPGLPSPPGICGLPPTQPAIVALPPVPAGCYWMRSLASRGQSLPRLEPVELPIGETILRPRHDGVKLWIKSGCTDAATRLYLRRMPDAPDAHPVADRMRTFGTEDCSERLIWPGPTNGATARDLDPGVYEVLLTHPARGWVVRRVLVGTADVTVGLEPETPCSELVVQLLGARRPEVDGWRVRLRSLDHGVVIVKDWVPARERVHQAGMPQGRWTAELLRPDGSVESTATGVARASRTLTLILR